MRVAIYARVSSPEQALKYGIEAQEAAGYRWAADQGYPDPVVRVEPGVSAFSDDIADRPAFAALMADVAAGQFDIIVVDQIDRFARSNLVAVQQLRHLYAHRCALVSLKERWDFSTASGRFQFQLMASLAEFDSRLKSERVKGAIAAKRAKGGYHGGYPFGAQPNPAGGLMVDPLREDSLRRLLLLAAEKGALTIASALTAEGVPTRRGHAVWHPSGVHSFIKTGAWLLDQPEPWPTLYRAARDRPRLPNVNLHQNVNLLTGLMRCACGGVIVYSSVRQNATGQRYLACRNYSKDRPSGQRCPIRGKHPATHYEALVEAEFLSIPPLTKLPEDPTVAEARVRLAERRLAAEEVYMDNLDRAAYRTRLAALDAEEAQLPVPMPLGAAFVADLAASQERWRAGLLTVAEKNGLLRWCYEKVLISGPDAEVVPVPTLGRLLLVQGGARVAGTG